MKYIEHKKMFTFTFNGKRYRAMIKDSGHSYASINIYVSLDQKWYHILEDPIILNINGEGISRKLFYPSEAILSLIRTHLDKFIETKVKKRLESIKYKHTSHFDEEPEEEEDINGDEGEDEIDWGGLSLPKGKRFI